jgi:RNA polymerase sigma factor (sigma-70 family)
MIASHELLADYVKSGSEAAFRELVDRYLRLVFSTALRLVNGDVHAAEDVTQTVFLNLSTNAPKLSREPHLGGWLHQDTCYVASKTMRRERRRQARERQAAIMNSLQDHSGDNLDQVASILDEAINRLGRKNRRAILLRFFEQLDFRAVGAALGSSEDAARMRVNRALEKLQTILKRRGVILSTAALGTMMAGESVAAVPAGLALNVAETVFADTTIGAGTSATLLKIMAMTKPKLGILGAVLITGVVTSLVFQQQAEARLRAQNESLQHQSDQLAQLAAEHTRLSKLAEQENGPPESNRLDQLSKLRSGAALLRAQAPELATLREESRRSQQTAAPGAKTEFQIWEQVLAKEDCTQAWMQAFIAYAKANQGQLPAFFEQAASF